MKNVTFLLLLVSCVFFISCEKETITDQEWITSNSWHVDFEGDAHWKFESTGDLTINVPVVTPETFQHLWYWKPLEDIKPLTFKLSLHGHQQGDEYLGTDNPWQYYEVLLIVRKIDHKRRYFVADYQPANSGATETKNLKFSLIK